MAYLAAEWNGCLDTSTGVANDECVALRGNIQYCALASCRTAADELITPSCLNNPSESICLAAVNELELCNA